MSAFNNAFNMNTSEIKKHFEEPIIDIDSNILDYWKENEKRFPILSSMAKDFLSMMPTSVSSERGFSLAGLKITNTRANLHPDTANECICLTSWKHVFNSNKK